MDPVVDLSNTFSNLFISSPALPYAHYTTDLNGPWSEPIYGRLPPQPIQPIQTPRPIGLPHLLVYTHRVDRNAPLGSFENPYSSFNAPPLPKLSPPNTSDTVESAVSINTFESLEPRPPTPPKRIYRRSSDDRQKYHGSSIQLESVRSGPSPEPVNQSRNTQTIRYIRKRSRRPPRLQSRPEPQRVFTPHRPPPVHHSIRRVRFASSNGSLSPPLSSPLSSTSPLSASGSPPPSFSRPPSPPPLRHHSPPYSPPLPYYSSPSPLPRVSTSSTSYSIRTYEWPLCMLCDSKPVTIEDEDMRCCRACWEEAMEAERRMKRGRWWRDA